jgi:hypothetical protein
MRTRKTDTTTPANDETTAPAAAAATAPAPAAHATNGASDDPVNEAGTLTADDHDLIDRASKFLVGVQNPTYLRKVRKEGYTPAEHALGWGLWKKAAGADRPLDHWLGEPEPEVTGDGVYQLAILRELEVFETTWQPRVRALVERVVAEAEQDAMIARLFDGLAPEPLSPAIVARVRTFLDRLDELGTEGTETLAEKLLERGLTPATVKSVRGLCAEAEGGSPRPASGEARAAGPSPEVIRAAHEAQLTGVKELRRWFNDWATMLRTVLGPREQLRLGLQMSKTRGPNAPKSPAAEA